MKFIKGFSRFIYLASLYMISAILLFHDKIVELVSIPDFTENSLIAVIGALLVIGNIASFFYQGIKDAIKGLIVEGVLLGIIYLISTTLGSDMDMTKLLIYVGIMIICIPGHSELERITLKCTDGQRSSG